MVSRIILISLFVTMACAATMMGSLPKKPPKFENKVGCYITEINDVIPFGKTISPLGGCYRIECTKHFIEYASCGTVSGKGTECDTTDIDLSKPYPDCCPVIKCDIDNNLI